MNGEGYSGNVGTTAAESIHFSCTCGETHSAEIPRAINAATDPELARRLRGEPQAESITCVRCPTGSFATDLAIPVVYHDPAVDVFALVVPDVLRHLELELRGEVYARLAADRECAVPDYVREFTVVFGTAGLCRLLETRAESALASARDDERAELREAAVDEREVVVAEHARRVEAHSRRVGERERVLVQRETELCARERSIAERAAALEQLPEQPTEPSPAARPDSETEAPAPAPAKAKSSTPERQTDRFELVERAPSEPPPPPGARAAPEPDAEDVREEDIEAVEDIEATDDIGDEIAGDEEAVFASSARPSKRTVTQEDSVVVHDEAGRLPDRPSTVDGATQVGGAHDVAIERWSASGDSVLIRVDDAGNVHLAICVPREQFPVVLGDKLQLRVQLHRLPSYPLVTVSLGPISAFVGDAGAEPCVFPFDIGHDEHRAVLERLSERFCFVLEVFDSEYSPVRRRTVTAMFAENTQLVLDAGHSHLGSISEHDRSFDRAMLAFSAPDYDRFGRRHPERREFSDEALQTLDSPAQLLHALSIVRRFSQPEREDYLMLLRGYPRSLWQQRRLSVLRRAIDVGLWMGRSMADLAIVAGLASSNEQLARTLQRNFAQMVDRTSHRLDSKVVSDNWASLREEMRRLGMASDAGIRPRTHAIASEGRAEASGTIGRVTSLMPAGPKLETDTTPLQDVEPGESGPSLTDRKTESVLALLTDNTTRLRAAMELTLRGDVDTVESVFETLARMTRAEAGRVLGSVVRFGGAAIPHLLEGLRSHKGFIRQGCALALAVLKDDRGVEAVGDLLVDEPTEIWREVARAMGEVGTGAVMPLAARIARVPADRRERLVWALAHVAARGGIAPVETMSRGRDPVAAGIARHALELKDLAESDDAAVRGERAPRDQTVNRAFSRRFFEAMDSGAPLAPIAAEGSAPAMVLDEADLLEATDLEAAGQGSDAARKDGHERRPTH